MSTNDKYVSPYLLQPPRSQEDVLRERAKCSHGNCRREEPANTDARDSMRDKHRCGADKVPSA